MLYLLNEFFIKSWTFETTTFFRHFFNDLLAPTLLLAYTTILCTLCGYGHIIRFWWMFALVAASGLFWEYVTPIYLERSTADPLDLIMYLLGFFVYWLIAKSFPRSLV